MPNDDLSRRDFLRRTAAIGVVTMGPGFLAACGGGAETGGNGGNNAAGNNAGGNNAAGNNGGMNAGDGGEMAALDCSDTSGLTDTEITTRESLQYVEASENPDQLCSNCQQWEPPETEGTCGGCAVVPGPINPDGWCTAWVEQEA